MFKKGFILSVVFILLITVSSFGDTEGINIYVNIGDDVGDKIEFDVKPFINSDSRTLVPVRFISESLGYDVKWNGDDYQVEITGNDTVVYLPINEKKAVVNGEEKSFDTTTIIKEGRTFVPLRFISETFGAEVLYRKRNDYKSEGEMAHIININVRDEFSLADINYISLEDWEDRGWREVGSLKDAPYTSKGQSYVEEGLDFEKAIVEIGEFLKLGDLNISGSGQVSVDTSEAGKNANQFYDTVNLGYDFDTKKPVIEIRTWVSTDNSLGMPEIYAMNGTREMLKFFTNSEDAEAIYKLVDTSFRTKSFAYDYGEEITFGDTTFKITGTNEEGMGVDLYLLETK